MEQQRRRTGRENFVSVFFVCTMMTLSYKNSLLLCGEHFSVFVVQKSNTSKERRREKKKKKKKNFDGKFFPRERREKRDLIFRRILRYSREENASTINNS